MAPERPLDLAVVQAWLAAWHKRDGFSDAAVLHLQSLIVDTHCLVVITLGVGRVLRSLVFRRLKRVLEADHEASASSNPTFRWDKWPRTLSSSLASSMFVSPPARRFERGGLSPPGTRADRREARGTKHDVCAATAHRVWVPFSAYGSEICRVFLTGGARFFSGEPLAGGAPGFWDPKGCAGHVGRIGNGVVHPSLK
jgi:hypothetical protein